ncbi:hypothetical protein TRFO_14922 [Tritrichomonas foetus]|uniref:Kinase n=1 Tax=Tritrichomonas foetus TaxID=1144522 RepID=A0A1J4KYJ3_9EUKA|nr:hypothetical protein TRFO_14922 [Tritrichomonas foetus]|eukprot:OHT14629.1 hypothetical protein TRFO_14922 [Tritrichomonas foetus]
MESVVYESSMESQGGGHGRIRTCKVQPGNHAAISKPLDHNEGKAYEDLQKTPLKAFIPKFWGINKDSDGVDYLIIDDLTDNLESPCIADLKVGKRHYDINATDDKKKGLIAKQKGSTTDSLGVRLIDAKIRQGGNVVKSWDKKQGLAFTFDELQEVFDEFIPPELKKQFSEKCDAIYAAFDETLEKNPGFRMYAASLLVAYDGEKKDQLKMLLIDFAHTHINIASEGSYDPDDDEYEDGVLQGLATLMNFAESSHDVDPHEKGQVEVQFVEDGEKHKGIRKCIVNPGNHKCIMRPNDPNESESITLFMSTPISEFIPKVFDISNNKAIVEDINSEFESPCIADFKVGSKSYDIDDPKEVKSRQIIKDDTTTTSKVGIRLTMAIKTKNNSAVKAWEKKSLSNINDSEENLSKMVSQFADDTVLAENIAKELVKLKVAYEDTLEENPNLRMYDLSILICYDGNNTSQTPRCVFNKLGESHLDIKKEGYSTDKENDDGFLDGIQNLIKYFSADVAEKSLSSKSSKCCLLL